MDRGNREGDLPSPVASVLAGMLRDVCVPEEPPAEGGQGAGPDASVRFDFDLAEFPLFRFYKNAPGRLDRDPLVYADTIRGRDGEAVSREWKAYPGPFGFGGPSTQVLLYDLLQLYAGFPCADEPETIICQTPAPSGSSGRARDCQDSVAWASPTGVHSAPRSEGCSNSPSRSSRCARGRYERTKKTK
jgi:hypothetical protein